MKNLTDRFLEDFYKSSVFARAMSSEYQKYWEDLFRFYNENHGSSYWGAVREAALMVGITV